MDASGGVTEINTTPTRRSSLACEWPSEVMAPAAAAHNGDLSHEHLGIFAPGVEQQEMLQQQVDELWPQGSGQSGQVGCREQACTGHVEPRLRTEAATGGDAMNVCAPQRSRLQQQGESSRGGPGASRRGRVSVAQRVALRRGRGRYPPECAQGKQLQEEEEEEEEEEDEEEDGQQEDDEEEEQQALPGPVTVRVMTKRRRARQMDSDEEDCGWATSVTGACSCTANTTLHRCLVVTVSVVVLCGLLLEAA